MAQHKGKHTPHHKWLKYLSLSCCSLFLIHTTTVKATTFNQLNNNFSAALTWSNINYTEFAHGFSGRKFDQNNGNIYGLSLGFRRQFHKIYLELGLKALQGNTPYKGATQRSIPVKGNNAPSFVSDSHIKLGYSFESGQRFEVLPYLQIGYHTWQRSIAGSIQPFGFVNGAQENYRNGYYAAGLKLTWQFIQNWFINIYGSYGRTFNAHAYNPGAAHVFYLKSRPWLELGSGIDYFFKTHWHLFAAISYNEFSYGKSKPFQISPGFSSAEPNSLTKYISGYLGIAYDFANTDSKQTTTTYHNTLARINNLAGFSVIALYQNFTAGRSAIINTPLQGRFYGFIPGISLSASKQFFKHWVLQLHAEYAEADVSYKNMRTHQEFKSHQADSAHYLAETRFGYQWQWANKTVALEPLITLGYQRDLYTLRKSSANLQASNYYYFGYIGPGIQAIWLTDHQRLALIPAITGGLTFGNTANTNQSNNISTHFHPANGAPWFALNLDMDYLLTQHLHLTGGIGYRFVKFNSDRDILPKTPPMALYEPKAWYRTPSLKIGLSYDFA